MGHIKQYSQFLVIAYSFIFLSTVSITRSFAMDNPEDDAFIHEIFNADGSLDEPQEALIFTDYHDSLPAWNTDESPLSIVDAPNLGKRSREEEESLSEVKRTKRKEKFFSIKNKFNSFLSLLLGQTIEERVKLKNRLGLLAAEDNELEALYFEDIDRLMADGETIDSLAVWLRRYYWSITLKGSMIEKIKHRIGELFDLRWLAPDFSPEKSFKILTKKIKIDLEKNGGRICDSLYNAKIIDQKEQRIGAKLLPEVERTKLRKAIAYHAHQLAIFYNKQSSKADHPLLIQIEKYLHGNLLITLPAVNPNHSATTTDDLPVVDGQDACAAYYLYCLRNHLLTIHSLAPSSQLFLTKFTSAHHDSSDLVKQHLCRDIQNFLASSYQETHHQ